MIVFSPFSRYISIVLSLFFLTCSDLTAQIPLPKHEVRAVWLTTIGGLDWPHSHARSTASIKTQQNELCSILDKLKAANVNTVLLQTRIRGTVIYPSIYEPWDGCLSGIPGTSPGYDALQFAIDECHKRGMELHAWVVTIPVGKWNKTGCQRLRSKHPKMLKRIGEDGYMNPECNETAEYLGNICREITRNYDIDGIHLDYIRYPETWKMSVSREQGRRHITAIVKQIYKEVKSLKPWVKLSCSPVGKHDDLTRYDSRGWNARTKVCQDAQAWMRNGLMDELFPMMYFRDNQFYPFALDWKENSYERIIAVGLGIYFLSSKEKNWHADVVRRQMGVLRRHGLGHAYFRSQFFTDNTKGIYDFAAKEIDRHPALIPPLTWESAVAPLPPDELKITHKDNIECITWSGAIDLSDVSRRSSGMESANYLLYNVYASPEWPVDISDASNLVAVRYQGESITIERKNGSIPLYYAVTATDRYGNESKPICSPEPEREYVSGIFLPNDGKTLVLPGKKNVLDAHFIAIETLQGTIVSTKVYNNGKTDISDIPDGFYVLKSLGRKGITHRIGYFIIKRKQHKH